MKADQFMYAVIGGGIVALTWVAASLAGSISVESVIGYGLVAGIAALAAMDYRIRVRKLFR